MSAHFGYTTDKSRNCCRVSNTKSVRYTSVSYGLCGIYTLPYTSQVSYSRETDHSTRTIMKSIAVAVLALMCVLGLCQANYGYGYGYPSTGSSGNGGFLMLIGLLFLLMILFGNNSSTSTSGTVTIVNGSATG